MWFAMKFGESFATTTPLPRCRSANCVTRATTSRSVAGVGINSSRCRYRGGLKKCVPRKCRAEIVAAAVRRAPRSECPTCSRRRWRLARRTFFDALEQRALWLELFDDRLDDPIGTRKDVEVGVEAAGSHRRGALVVKNASGFRLPGARQSLARHVRADVEEQSSRRRHLRNARRFARPSCPRRERRRGESQLASSRFALMAGCAVDKQVEHAIGFGLERISSAAQYPVRRHLVERAKEHFRACRRVELCTK